MRDVYRLSELLSRFNALLTQTREDLTALLTKRVFVNQNRIELPEQEPVTFEAPMGVLDVWHALQILLRLATQDRAALGIVWEKTTMTAATRCSEDCEISVTDLLAGLNAWREQDPVGIQNLINTRVPVQRPEALHESRVSTLWMQGRFWLGVMGLLNYLFEGDPETGFLAAWYTPEHQLQRFARELPSPVIEKPVWEGARGMFN